ncbi:hypothetical protein V8C40DRAFT_250016, partial [Trichoderma camerunense]
GLFFISLNCCWFSLCYSTTLLLYTFEDLLTLLYFTYTFYTLQVPTTWRLGSPLGRGWQRRQIPCRWPSFPLVQYIQLMNDRTLARVHTGWGRSLGVPESCKGYTRGLSTSSPCLL